MGAIGKILNGTEIDIQQKEREAAMAKDQYVYLVPLYFLKPGEWFWDPFYEDRVMVETHDREMVRCTLRRKPGVFCQEFFWRSDASFVMRVPAPVELPPL
jgi:hypothetical protein